MIGHLEIMSGVRDRDADHPGALGWTNTDKDRFLLEVSARLRAEN